MKKSLLTILLAFSLMLPLTPLAFAEPLDPVEAVIAAIAELPDPEMIVPNSPGAGEVAYNDPALIAEIGHPASGSGASAVPATGIYALINDANAGGAVDGDFTNLTKFNAVIAEINSISVTPAGTMDFYLVGVDGISAPAGTYDLGACVEYPDVLLIKDGAITAITLIAKPNVIPSAGMMGAPPDGRYMATVNGGGVVLSVVRTYEDRRVFSVEVVGGELKLGVFNNANSFIFSTSAVAHIYKMGDIGLEVIGTKTIDDYKSEVAGYPNSFDWDDEVNIFYNPSSEVSEIFVMRNDMVDAYQVAEYNKKYELFKPAVQLTDSQLEAAGIASSYARKNDIRSIDAGIYNPVKNGASDAGKYPVFIWLQGITNGRSEQWHFINTNPANFSKPFFQNDFDEGAAFIVVPRCNEHILDAPSWMTTSGGISVYQPAVIQLIKEFLDEYSEYINMDRIYISGFSAGGFMTWDALHGVQTGDYGFKFAAAAPLCPASNITNAKIGQLSDVPIWLMYGKYDGLVGSNATIMNLVKGFSVAAQDNARVTLFETVIDPFGATLMQHSIWTAIEMNMIYNNNIPTNYAIATTANGILWRAGAAVVGDPPIMDGEHMQYYGTIFDTSDSRYIFGADPTSNYSNDGTFVSWLNKWGEPELPPIVSINGPSSVTYTAGETATYTVSIENAPDITAVQLTLRVDGSYFDTKSYDGLNGFSSVGFIEWEDVGGGIYEGTIVLASNGSCGDIDVFQIEFNLKGMLGTTQVELVDFKIAYEGVWIEYYDGDMLAVTSINQWYSIYDLNQDGVVDLRDISIAMMYFMADEGDANWDKAKIADVNTSGAVDIDDLILIRANFS